MFSCSKESCYEDKACDSVEISFNNKEVVVKNKGYKRLVFGPALFILFNENYQDFSFYRLTEKSEIKRNRSLRIGTNEFTNFFSDNPLLEATYLRVDEVSIFYPECDNLYNTYCNTDFLNK